MTKMKVLLALVLLMTLASSCSTQSTVTDDEFAAEATAGDLQASQDLGSSATDSTEVAMASGAESTDSMAQASPPASDNSGADLEAEFAQQDSAQPPVSAAAAQTPAPAAPVDNLTPPAAAQPQDDFALFDNQDQKPADPSLADKAQIDKTSTDKTPTPLPIQPEQTTPPPMVTEAPVSVPVHEDSAIPQIPIAPSHDSVAAHDSSSAPAADLAHINSVNFVSNKGGGALVIGSNKPVNFRTRMNSVTQQLVVEVVDAVMPDKLKRPLNTRDMTSSIGSVDSYQKKNSSVARFVVQLRPQSPEPLVQMEGNNLLIIGSPIQKDAVDAKAAHVVSVSTTPTEVSGDDDEKQAQVLNSLNDLSDFLDGNSKFYGKKISIETTDMDIRDILKFISEEGGINMIFDDDVSGRVSVKLRKVPWDQALVTILRSKKFAFKRQGDILRIAKYETLAKEEVDALQMKEAKQKVEPLIVKNFQINYADVASLEAKIRDFVADSSANQQQNGMGGNQQNQNVNRGKVTSDLRTNTVIVTDTATKMAQVEKLIQALDVQPQQVLIEGRVVEASETYGRALGAQLNANTGDGTIPGSSRVKTRLFGSDDSSGALSLSPSFTTTPKASGSFNGSLWLGQLGAFGDLSIKLMLDESENKVKILSAPRVTVLHNQTATINQGTTIQVPTGEISAVGNSSTTQKTFKDVALGVNLSVTPIISSIGTVNLKLKITKKALSPGSDSQTSDRAVDTNIIVRNGDTAVLGGVFQTETGDTSTGVPGLKNIPILGALFRSDTISKSKTELMFFVSPTIIKSFDAPMNAGADGSPRSTF